MEPGGAEGGDTNLAKKVWAGRLRTKFIWENGCELPGKKKVFVWETGRRLGHPSLPDGRFFFCLCPLVCSRFETSRRPPGHVVWPLGSSAFVAGLAASLLYEGNRREEKRKEAVLPGGQIFDVGLFFLIFFSRNSRK